MRTMIIAAAAALSLAAGSAYADGDDGPRKHILPKSFLAL